MPAITLIVNGATHSVDTDPERSLLEVLREDLDLTGTKFGCGEGSCRSCTVLLGNRPVTSCQTTVSEAAGKEITTIEGLASADDLHPVQQAFLDEFAMQCGYCVPGMILTAVALLRANPNPTRQEIAQFMNGNICRCCNYVNILNAIEAAAKSIASEAAV